MVYIPISKNIGLSLGEITYDDLQDIYNIVQGAKNICCTKRKKKLDNGYIILFNKHICNQKDKIIICYHKDKDFLLRNTVNKSFYVTNSIEEIEEIISFFNKTGKIKYLN